MKTNEVLLLAGAGIAIWYFGFGPGKSGMQLQVPAQAANPLLPAGVQPLALSAPPLISDSSLNPVSIPVPGANMQTQTNQNPFATQAQQQTIFNWANTMKAADQAAFYANWGNMTQADIAGLMDLIVNEWQGNQPVTPARTAFWNAWRNKYSIDVT